MIVIAWFIIMISHDLFKFLILKTQNLIATAWLFLSSINASSKKFLVELVETFDDFDFNSKNF